MNLNVWHFFPLNEQTVYSSLKPAAIRSIREVLTQARSRQIEATDRRSGSAHHPGGDALVNACQRRARPLLLLLCDGKLRSLSGQRGEWKKMSLCQYRISKSASVSKMLSGMCAQTNTLSHHGGVITVGHLLWRWEVADGVRSTPTGSVLFFLQLQGCEMTVVRHVWAGIVRSYVRSPEFIVLVSHSAVGVGYISQFWATRREL